MGIAAPTRWIGIVSLLVLTEVCGAGGVDEATSATEPLVIRYCGMRALPGSDTPIKGLLEDMISDRIDRRITFELLGGVPDSEYGSTVDLLLAAEDYPDVFLRFNIDPEFLRYAAAKFELSMMEENAPRYTARLIELMRLLGKDEERTWARYQDSTDSLMWGMPRIWEWGWIPSGPMWRKDIIDDLGYGIPTTIEEAEIVFDAYKVTYPDKYPLSGPGKVPWQCFDFVFNAFGICGGGHFVRDGTVVESFATREFRQSLVVLRRWYERGYWDPGFLGYSAASPRENFARGRHLVVSWLRDWDFATGLDTIWLNPLRDGVPGAMAVAATHIAADEYTKPAQRVWDPFIPQVTVFGKHLEADLEKLAVIMQIGDLLAMRSDEKWLAGYGIEGEHYTIPEGETVPQPLPSVSGLSTEEIARTYGFGSYWISVFGGVNELDSRRTKLYEDFVTSPGAIFSREKIDYIYPIVNGPVTDELGNPVTPAPPASWFEVAVDVMIGLESIEYYDEWLQRYYDSGGREWERHATRLWLE
jgi:putative aldouronate transport system substrate-binding protein